MPIDTDYAYRLAQRDLANLREDAHSIRTSTNSMMQTDENDTALLVDGSMYSPSYRALYGGNEAYTMAGQLEEDAATDFLMAYEELLDEAVENIGAYWEDGCLWLGL